MIQNLILAAYKFHLNPVQVLREVKTWEDYFMLVKSAEYVSKIEEEELRKRKG